jgi:sec-independent protein translocase protein TatB
MGFGELVLVVIVAIVVIGPKDLPKVLKKLGMWSGKLRRMAFDLRSQSGIDDVLRGEGLGKDIAEIRKLARGEIESVSRDIRIDDGPAYSPPDPYIDAALGASFVSEDREHPIVGPDGFDAMPDTSFVYDASFPRSALDRDPLYRTGSVDGIVPDDPVPDEGDDGETDADSGEPSEPTSDVTSTDPPSDGTASGVAAEAPLRAEAPEAEKSAP